MGTTWKNLKRILTLTWNSLSLSAFPGLDIAAACSKVHHFNLSRSTFLSQYDEYSIIFWVSYLADTHDMISPVHFITTSRGRKIFDFYTRQCYTPVLNHLKEFILLYTRRLSPLVLVPSILYHIIVYEEL